MVLYGILTKRDQGKQKKGKFPSVTGQVWTTTVVAVSLAGVLYTAVPTALRPITLGSKQGKFESYG